MRGTLATVGCRSALAGRDRRADPGDLTREGILTAKQNLGEADLGGITPAVTYTPEGGPPSRASLITEIDPTVPGFLKVVESAHASEVADGIDISQ